MSASDKKRIVELQRQVKVARDILSMIAYGHSRNPQSDAEDALFKMWPLDPKQPLQGVVGHKP